jgi:hypothetical protein
MGNLSNSDEVTGTTLPVGQHRGHLTWRDNTMNENEKALQQKAMEILQRKIEGKPRENEWVLNIGPTIQISWIKEGDTSKSIIVNVWCGEFMPFEVDNETRLF